MNQKAFYKLTYGVYIISASAEGKDGGCVVNTLSQVTSSPACLSVALNKNNHTLHLIQASGSFTGTVLSDQADMDLIRRFGFQSSRDKDKFQGIPMERDCLDNPYPTEGISARFSCRVISTLDLGSHVLVIGEAEDAEVLDESAPVLTYSDYHLKKKGTTPPNAPSYQEAPKTVVGWRCSVCGYILESDTLPEDFVCPVCGRDASYFVKL